MPKVPLSIVGTWKNTVMKQKRAQISYSFEELPSGGRVRIKTTDQDALKAVQDFLRFQIEDHHTGDSMDIASL
jgi:hypothetical protein